MTDNLTRLPVAPANRTTIDKVADGICDAFECYAPVPAVLRSEAANIARSLAEDGLLAGSTPVDGFAEDTPYEAVRTINRGLGAERDMMLWLLAEARHIARDNLSHALREGLQVSALQDERDQLQARVADAAAIIDKANAEWSSPGTKVLPDPARVIDAVHNALCAERVAHCVASIQASADPEDGEGCPNPREPGSVFCEGHRIA